MDQLDSMFSQLVKDVEEEKVFDENAGVGAWIGSFFFLSPLVTVIVGACNASTIEKGRKYQSLVEKNYKESDSDFIPLRKLTKKVFRMDDKGDSDEESPENVDSVKGEDLNGKMLAGVDKFFIYYDGKTPVCSCAVTNSGLRLKRKLHYTVDSKYSKYKDYYGAAMGISVAYDRNSVSVMKKLCEELKAKANIEVDKKTVSLNHPINKVGEYTMLIKLTSKVKTELKIVVTASEIVKESIEEEVVEETVAE